MKYLFFFCLLIFISCATQETENIDQQKVEVSTVTDSLATKIEIPKPTFRMALDSLVNLKYQYEVKEFREIPIDSASLILRVNSFIELVIEVDEEPMDSVPNQYLQSIQFAFVKGEKAIWGNTYPRSYIEEWTFTNSEEAKRVVKFMERYTDEYGTFDVAISRMSPFDYLQLDNKLYLIETGGEYMRGEEIVLKKALVKYLKSFYG
jgi:hypothetical protein